MDALEDTKQFNDVKYTKIPYTGTILSISPAELEINNRSCIILGIRFTIGFCYVTKRSRASYAFISLEPDTIMKHGWLHFKAEKGYQPCMCISFE